DVLTIMLSARHEPLRYYYAIMATVGSVLGGYVTYRLPRKGGGQHMQAPLFAPPARGGHKPRSPAFRPPGSPGSTSSSSVGASGPSPFPLRCHHRCPWFHSCARLALRNIPRQNSLLL